MGASVSEYPTIPISATAIQGVPIDTPAGAAYVATFNSGIGRVVWAPTQSVGVQDVQADSPLSAGSDPAHPEISIASPIPVTLGGTSIDTSGLTGRPKLAAGVPSVAAINLATEVTGTLPVANGGTGGTSAATALAALGIRSGRATLVGGTVTVSDAATTTTTVVAPFLTLSNTTTSTASYEHVYASNVAGVSFTLRANVAAGTINILDVSTLGYIAVG